MAQFKCGSCGHLQNVQDELAGRKVRCPACHQSGTVTRDVEPAAPVAVHEGVAGPTGSPRTIIARVARWAHGGLPFAAIALLLTSVVLQAMIFLKLSITPTNQPATVQFDKSQVLPVAIRDSCKIDVDVENYSPIPVSLESEGLVRPLPISIDSIGATEELNVNLRNHYIISADPIPVEIER